MAVKPVSVRKNRATTGSNADFSDHVWGDCPLGGLRDNSVSGWLFEDDFLSFPVTPATTEGNWGQYAQFSSTGGTITAGTGQGGEAIFASDGDNEGASIRTLATPFKINRSTKKLWFGARVKFSTITDTKNGVFFGLMENAALTATVPIAADGTIADQNLVGFWRREGDGDAVDTIYRANGVAMAAVGADAVTIAADTYVVFEMKYEPDPDLHVGTKYLLTFYANGVRLADTKQIPSTDGDDFPNDVALGLVFAVLNATGSTPGNATLDKWRCAQLLY